MRVQRLIRSASRAPHKNHSRTVSHRHSSQHFFLPSSLCTIMPARFSGRCFRWGWQASLPLRLGYLVNEHRPRLSIHDDGLGDVGMRVAYRYATILHRTRSRGGNSKRGGYRSSQRGGGGRRGAGATSGHPVEDFVQSKLAEEFTETGAARGAHRKRDRGGGVGLRTASEDAWRTGRERDVFKTSSKRGGGSEADGGSGDRYTRLLIPGTIYHIRKLGAESAAASSASVCSEKPLGLRSKLYWMERQQPEEVCVCVGVDFGAGLLS